MRLSSAAFSDSLKRIAGIVRDVKAIKAAMSSRAYPEIEFYEGRINDAFSSNDSSLFEQSINSYESSWIAAYHKEEGRLSDGEHGS